MRSAEQIVPGCGLVPRIWKELTVVGLKGQSGLSQKMLRKGINKEFGKVIWCIAFDRNNGHNRF